MLIREVLLIALAVVLTVVLADAFPQRGCDPVSALPWLRCER